jgi:hypothetical protein
MRGIRRLKPPLQVVAKPKAKIAIIIYFHFLTYRWVLSNIRKEPLSIFTLLNEILDKITYLYCLIQHPF